MLFSLTIVCLAVCGAVVCPNPPQINPDCKLDFDAGLCAGNIPVWTYNTFADECVKAVYGGCGGNGNRFNTKNDCLSNCKPRGGDCEFNFERGRCELNITVWTFNSNKGVCEEAVYGGCGGNNNNYETKKNCVLSCYGQDVCGFDFDGGICNAYMPVWAFNFTTGLCEKEIYNGCGGNKNKFKTKNACLNRCNPKDICQFEFESVNCKAKTSVWAFNSTTGVCEKEIYGGCGGSWNKFNTKRECNQRCLLTDVPV